MISEEDGAVRAGAYNPVRNAVIEWARDFLDTHFIEPGQPQASRSLHHCVGDLLINQIDGSLSMFAAHRSLAYGERDDHQVSCLSTMASTLKYKSTVSTQWEARMPQASGTYA